MSNSITTVENVVTVITNRLSWPVDKRTQSYYVYSAKKTHSVLINLRLGGFYMIKEN